MNRLSSRDRESLIRLASSLPKGDETRRAILSGLKSAEEASSEDEQSEARSLSAMKDIAGMELRSSPFSKGRTKPKSTLMDDYRYYILVMPKFMKEFERRFFNRTYTWTEAVKAIKFEGLDQSDLEGMERYMNRGEEFESILNKAFKKKNNPFRNMLLKPSNFDKVWDFSQV